MLLFEEDCVDLKQFEFQWDEAKAAANVRKHGVSFELASTVFQDAQLLTVASNPMISARRATRTEIRQYEEPK